MPRRAARFLSFRAPFAKRLAAALLFLAGTALADGGEAPAAAAGAKDDRFGIWKPGMDGTPFLAVCTNAALPQSVRTEAAFRWLASTDWAGRTVSDFGTAMRTATLGDCDADRQFAVDRQVPVQWNGDEFLYAAWAPCSTEEKPVPDVWFTALFTVDSKHAVADVLEAFRSGTNDVIRVEDLGFRDSRGRIRFSAKTGAIIEANPDILEDF